MCACVCCARNSVALFLAHVRFACSNTFNGFLFLYASILIRISSPRASCNRRAIINCSGKKNSLNNYRSYLTVLFRCNRAHPQRREEKCILLQLKILWMKCYSNKLVFRKTFYQKDFALGIQIIRNVSTLRLSFCIYRYSCRRSFDTGPSMLLDPFYNPILY